MVIFSAVILGLVGFSFQIARNSARATDQALQMAAQLSAADRAATVPYDSLRRLLTADTIRSGGMRVFVRYVVDSIDAVRKNVRIITSTSVPGSRSDTLLIQRGRVRLPIPLR